MMKNHKKTVGALAAATAMLTGYALAGEPAPAPVMEPAPTNDFFSGELHVGYNSNYEFRFVDRGDNMVEVGLDGAFDLGNGWGINVGAWYAGINEDNAWSVANFTTPNELDLYFGVRKDFGVVDVEAGYIYYYFDDSAMNWLAGPVPGAGLLWTNLQDTQEIYASLGVNLPWDVRFATTYYWDIDTYSGWYWDFKLTKSFEFTDCLSLDLAVGTAMADGQGLQRSAKNSVGTDDGYQGWYASAALPWKILDTVTLTPYIKYTDADSDLATSLVGVSSGKDMVIGGVTFAVSF